MGVPILCTYTHFLALRGQDLSSVSTKTSATRNLYMTRHCYSPIGGVVAVRVHGVRTELF